MTQNTGVPVMQCHGQNLFTNMNGELTAGNVILNATMMPHVTTLLTFMVIVCMEGSVTLGHKLSVGQTEFAYMSKMVMHPLTHSRTCTQPIRAVPIMPSLILGPGAMVSGATIQMYPLKQCVLSNAMLIQLITALTTFGEMVTANWVITTIGAITFMEVMIITILFIKSGMISVS